MSAPKTIGVLRHVPYERLGTFEPTLNRARFDLVDVETPKEAGRLPKASAISGLIVMGGPMSVNDRGKLSYLSKELDLIRAALDAGIPILGVCLGAQLLAASAGAKVYPNPSKEIGWYPLMRESGADGDPLMDPFGQTETVFQWHGDTFDLPKGAAHLASSPLCANQAFRLGKNAYGLQFHVEVNEAIIRLWMTNPNGRKELAAVKGTIDPAAIKRQNPEHLDRLQTLSQHVAQTFCNLIEFQDPSGGKTHARQARASA